MTKGRRLGRGEGGHRRNRHSGDDLRACGPGPRGRDRMTAPNASRSTSASVGATENRPAMCLDRRAVSRPPGGAAACLGAAPGRRFEFVEPLERRLHSGERPGVVARDRGRDCRSMERLTERPASCSISAFEDWRRPAGAIGRLAPRPRHHEVAERGQQLTERPLHGRDVHAFMDTRRIAGGDATDQ